MHECSVDSVARMVGAPAIEGDRFKPFFGVSGAVCSAFARRKSGPKSYAMCTAIQRNEDPVKRRLVLEPQQCEWSSYRHYAEGERGIVLMNEQQKAEMKARKIA